MQVHDKTFKTLKQMKDFTKHLIDITGEGMITEEEQPYEFKYFRELIKRHYLYKPNAVVSHFIIDYDIRTKKSNVMTVVYDDNHEHIISWNKCCTKSKPTDSKTLLTRAMRNAIAPSVQQYKTEHKYDSCVLCESHEETNVDHVLPFQEIRDYFIKYTVYKTPTEFDDEGYCIMFKKQDMKFMKSFIRHHDLYENNLQILCRNCNLKKSNSILLYTCQ